MAQTKIGIQTPYCPRGGARPAGRFRRTNEPPTRAAWVPHPSSEKQKGRTFVRPFHNMRTISKSVFGIASMRRRGLTPCTQNRDLHRHRRGDDSRSRDPHQSPVLGTLGRRFQNSVAVISSIPFVQKLNYLETARKTERYRDLRRVSVSKLPASTCPVFRRRLVQFQGEAFLLKTIGSA